MVITGPAVQRNWRDRGGMPGHVAGDVGPTWKLRKVQNGEKEATKSKEKGKEGNG